MEGAMRLLWKFVMCAVLAAGLAPHVSAQSSNVPIMPLSEIQPGMRGYGLTVFRGTEPERFEFEVRGIVPDFNGWPRVIVVQLFGGPKDENGVSLFDSGQVFGGMSGSPMYIDGKLIGGLAMARDFATTAKTLITPIEYQLELANIAPPKTVKQSTVRPGEYVGVCLVYGESDRCISSTVTAVHNGLIFTTAHSLGLPFGKAGYPAFRTPVVDLLESQAGATKLSGVRGDAIGTVVIHGAYGTVINAGEIPRTVPVVLAINDVYEKPVVMRWEMPYSTPSTGMLKDALRTVLAQLPAEAKATRMTVAIRLRNPEGVINIADTDAAATLSLERILDNLIQQEGDGLDVERVELEYHALKTNELWAPFAIQVNGKGNQGQLLVLARKSGDNALGEFTSRIDLTAIRCAKQPAQWLDGYSLQDEVLKRMPVRDALPVLEQIREHEALYLVTMESDESMRVEWPKKDGSTAPRRPTVNILAATDMGGRRFLMTGSKPMPYTVKQ